jgi:hypothetical protein
MIPKIGLASYSGKSSVIIESRYETSLADHLQEAGLRVSAIVPCDRRILGFNWKANEMVPIIDPSLEQTSEVWIKLEDPNHQAGELIGSWFTKRFRNEGPSAD